MLFSLSFSLSLFLYLSLLKMLLRLSYSVGVTPKQMAYLDMRAVFFQVLFDELNGCVGEFFARLRFTSDTLPEELRSRPNYM